MSNKLSKPTTLINWLVLVMTIKAYPSDRVACPDDIRVIFRNEQNVSRSSLPMANIILAVSVAALPFTNKCLGVESPQ